MFTVVIVEQYYMDCIQEHKLFLQPFFENNNAVFCRWFPEGETLSECVPDLRRYIAKGDEWRAIIVSDDGNLNSKNPFDRVCHTDPAWDENLSDEENCEIRKNARFESYKKAVNNPLTRLVQYFCEYPMVTSGKNNMSSDPVFREYFEEDARKKEIQEEIIGVEKADFILPSEIICLARRTYKDEEYDIKTSWTAHRDLEYSKFTKFNLYFAKMRFLVFDILPPEHKNYIFDNIRFLSALLLLAGNEMPRDSVKPDKVYVIDCINNQSRLSQMLQHYDDRLSATQKLLESEIELAKTFKSEPMTDKEVEKFMCQETNISVNAEKSFDDTGLYVHEEQFGLFTDTPQSEASVWTVGYRNSRKATNKYIQMPQRSIRVAAKDVRFQSDNVPNRAIIHRLNEVQIGDYKEFLENQESLSVSTRPTELVNSEKAKEKAKKAAEEVEKHIEGRIEKKTWIIALAVVLFAYLLGFVPLILAGKTNVWVWASLAGSLIILAAAAVICLFVFRAQMRACIRKYNNEIKGIAAMVTSCLSKFSSYLTHVCSLLKGNNIYNSYLEDCNEMQATVNVYKKHLGDVIQLREKFGLVFSQFLKSGQEVDPSAEPFEYDYKQVRSYEYPFLIDQSVNTVEFIQSDCLVKVPVSFVEKITIRREELYD